MKSVTMYDSKYYLGLQIADCRLQIADILTGVANSGFLQYLNTRLELSVAK